MPPRIRIRPRAKISRLAQITDLQKLNHEKDLKLEGLRRSDVARGEIIESMKKANADLRERQDELVRDLRTVLIQRDTHRMWQNRSVLARLWAVFMGRLPVEPHRADPVTTVAEVPDIG